MSAAWISRCFPLLALVVGAPSLALADEPFREVVLPRRVEAVRAVARGETVHVVYAEGKRCFYLRGEGGALADGDPHSVDPEGPEVIAGGERGPWVHAMDDAVLVLWQVRRGLHLVRSEDGGTTWERVTVRDEASEGADMPALVGGSDGDVYVVWVDGRHGKRAGDAVASELYMARSSDGGRTFGRDVRLTARAPGVCPCCQPSLAVDEDGVLWIGYRSSERNRKEIQLLRVADRGAEAAQVSDDRWTMRGCPMAGPELAVSGGARSLAIAWRKERDVHAAASRRGPSRFGEPTRLGRGTYYAAAADGRGRLLLLWDEGERTGYRELWEGGETGRLDAAPGGHLLGLPGGGFLRIRGR